MLGLKLRMWLLRSGSRFSTLATFHSQDSLLSRSDTMRSLSCRVKGPKGLRVSSDVI
ncbi:hypothetical protein F2Q70_00001475 [Brassica cretica]|uniref:Uncharacterized protein n=1 Tax=Brassica cretica TaxID=69181 RepID=A0A8S9IMV8_BRACR|nr:hypothetical protein F2Q70_00001475 [Brassica cretica]